MRNNPIIPAVMLILILASFPAAQFITEELAEREKWEVFLSTADVVGSEKPFNPREAVSEPSVLDLEKDGFKHRAIWKNPDGRVKGYIDRWRYEIAAYRMDKLLELNMVPPTVEKRYLGDRGSCQLMIPDCINLREKQKEGLSPPSYKIAPLNKATYIQRAFDNLIGNSDRNEGDILYTEDWRMLLVDHSRAFHSSGKYANSLINTENSPGGPMKLLPRALVENMKSLTLETIASGVGEYLNEAEIKAVLKRRDLIIKWLDKQIKELGEDNILY